MEQVYFNEDASVGFVTLENGDTISVATNVNKDEEIEQTVENNPDRVDQHVSPWGTNNLFPQELVEKIEKCDITPALIKWKADQVMGKRIVYGYEDEMGNPIRLHDKEINGWLKKSNAYQYAYEAFTERFTFNIHFAQLTFNRISTGIASVYCHDTTECRLSIQNQKNGRIEYCFIDANWKKSNDREKRKTLVALNPYFNVAGQIKLLLNKKTQKSAILPSRMIYRGRKYYPLPTWYGVMENGWFQVSQEIPKYKLALLQDDLKIRWHITIFHKYWTTKFPGWEDMDAKERTTKKVDEIKSMVKILKAKEESGALWSEMDYTNEGKEIQYWKVTQIKSDRSSGEYVQDSQEADVHIIRAHGVPIQVFGVNQKNGLGAGSGSDQRIGFNNWILSTHYDQQKVFEPLELVAEINGWNKRLKKDIKFWTEQFFNATLDMGKSLQDANEEPKNQQKT